MTHSYCPVTARLLPLCLLVGCQGETTTPTQVTLSSNPVTAMATDNVVAALTVVPDSQMVFVGGQFSIAARPRNKAGELLVRIPRWTVTNPAIVTAQGPAQAIMPFNALKVGKTSVKATVDTKNRFAMVVVRGTSGAKVVVMPAEVTLAGGATVQFTATGLTKAGETAGVNVTWSGTAGAITPTGVLTAGNTPGIFRVIARSTFGAADTATVTISATAPSPDPVAAVILVPETASLAAGESLKFEAYGRSVAGDSVGMTASYTATGGTISGSGLYTAGGIGGSFRVIASSAGLADTSEVTIASAPIGQVILRPDIAASRPGETTRFSATVLNTLNQPMSEPVTYVATCGSVTNAGVFTAPDQSGTCTVTASAGDKADITEVVLLTNVPDQGIPYGVFDLWSTGTQIQNSGTAAFGASHDYVPPSEMASHIAAARAQGVHLVLPMTGGSHDSYKTNGVFDLAKWQAAVDGYNTPAIQAAIADGVADGTIIGNSVMDEPQQSGTDSKAWGPVGTMTKARVDSLCGYVRTVFPTLPAGVVHDHAAFDPGNSYQVCEFFIPQYAARKGSVTAWRDAALAMAARDGMAVVFSINLLDGGVQDKTGAWDCAGTGGIGTHTPNCRMTATQVRDWGKLLGREGCAMLSWMFRADFMAKVENQEAFSDIAIALAGLPRTPCTKRGAAP
jgi:hypothetical protein